MVKETPDKLNTCTHSCVTDTVSAYHCCWIKDVIVCWCQPLRKWPGPVCVSHWQTVPHTGGQGQPRGTDRSSDLPVCVCACVRRMRGEMRPILSAIARCKTACLQWHKVSLHTSSPHNSPFKCTNKLTLINIAISVSRNSSALCSLLSLRKCLTFGRTKEETESEAGEGYHRFACRTDTKSQWDPFLCLNLVHTDASLAYLSLTKQLCYWAELQRSQIFNFNIAHHT